MRPVRSALKQMPPQVTPQVPSEIRLLMVMVGESSRLELQTSLGLKDNRHFRVTYLDPALESGWIEMTIPDKPRSSKQKYRLTARGRALLARQKERR